VSGGGGMIHFNIQGRPPASPHEFVMAGYRPCAPGYLETLHVPLLEGRYLESRDTERAPFAVVINHAMQRQFFAGESPLGKHIQLGATPDKDTPWMQIVGIVGDMKQNLATDPAAEMYLPFRQGNAVLPVFGLSLVVRTTGDPRAAVPALRQVVHAIDANQPLVKIRTMEENVSASVSAPRFRTILLAIFALSALALSGVGLYGVIAYSVAERSQEIGIRMALGARPMIVLSMVLRDGMALVGIGLAVGVIAALALGRLVASLLYGVSASDATTYLIIAGALASVALVAIVIPARRATRVDPMQALRSE
jgi:putative ABC transport system permease protein